MSNSDTFDYQLSQFAAWYLLEGIEQYLDCADETCQCETLLTELDRLEAWGAPTAHFTPRADLRNCARKLSCVWSGLSAGSRIGTPSVPVVSSGLSRAASVKIHKLE